jgi:hypothetical protein
MNTEARMVINREQRRRVRRSALLLGLIVLAVYTAFIVHAVLRAQR